MTVRIRFNPVAPVLSCVNLLRMVGDEGSIPGDLQRFLVVNTEQLHYLQRARENKILAEMNIVEFNKE